MYKLLLFSILLHLNSWTPCKSNEKRLFWERYLIFSHRMHPNMKNKHVRCKKIGFAEDNHKSIGTHPCRYANDTRGSLNTNAWRVRLKRRGHTNEPKYADPRKGKKYYDVIWINVADIKAWNPQSIRFYFAPNQLNCTRMPRKKFLLHFNSTSPINSAWDYEELLLVVFSCRTLLTFPRQAYRCLSSTACRANGFLFIQLPLYCGIVHCVSMKPNTVGKASNNFTIASEKVLSIRETTPDTLLIIYFHV